MSIALDLAAALDPVLLAEAAGIMPDPWQAEVMRSQSPGVLLNCSRQSGKSTTTGVVAAHMALYRPGSLTLVLSPGQRQSGELFRKCLAIYRATGRAVPAESETALTLELSNGSRIVALPGQEGTVRSFSGVDLLLIDEASRVSDGLYYAVRPMLAVSGGRLVALSTPFGKRGWWHDAWHDTGGDWERHEVPATLCPRISAAFLEQERRSMPRWWFQQEYECVFGETSDQVFGYDDVHGAVTDAVAPLFGGEA